MTEVYDTVPAVLLAEMGKDAALDLARPTTEYLGYPFSAVHDLVGSLAPGEVHFVAGFSGHGKTTFLRNCVLQWLASFIRVLVFPLETTPARYITELACARLGVYHGDVTSGTLGPDHSDVERVAEEVKRITTTGREAGLLRISPLSGLSARDLEEQIQYFANFGRIDAVVIDHIDHISADGQRDEWTEGREVCKLVLRLAQEYNLKIIVATQLNGEALKGGDRLAIYGPPQSNHVWNPQVKRQIASSMIGIYRPVRPRAELETEEEYAAARAAARKGDIEPGTMADPASMGVVVMKSRNYGSNEGRRMYLRYERGVLSDYSLVADRYRSATLRPQASRVRDGKSR